MIIPTMEPDELIVGDTWLWTRNLADYQQPTWVLTYYFENAIGNFSIACTNLVGAQSVSVAAGTTAGYTPGRYRYIGRVTDGTNILSVVSGEIDVLPNPAAAGNRDFRTRAQRIYDALLDLWERRASGRRTVTVDGITMTFDTQEDIMRALTRSRAEVQAEQNADRIKKGLGSKRVVRARM